MGHPRLLWSTRGRMRRPQGQDTPPIPIHKKRNKKFAAHSQHNATSARHITQLFHLGRFGVRSHNFCEVMSSVGGVGAPASGPR